MFIAGSSRGRGARGRGVKKAGGRGAGAPSHAAGSSDSGLQECVTVSLCFIFKSSIVLF